MWLFELNSSSPLVSYLKMYYCKIWDNGTLIKDYIPAKDENGIGCMFDNISKTCFYNQGSGEFIVGPEI